MYYLIIINENHKKSVVPFDLNTPQLNINFPYFVEAVFINGKKQISCCPYWSDFQNAVINSDVFDTSYLTITEFTQPDTEVYLDRSYFVNLDYQTNHTINLVDSDFKNSAYFKYFSLRQTALLNRYVLKSPIYDVDVGFEHSVYDWSLLYNDELVVPEQDIKIGNFYVLITDITGFLSHDVKLYLDLDRNRLIVESDAYTTKDFTTDYNFPYELVYPHFRISLRPFSKVHV